MFNVRLEDKGLGFVLSWYDEIHSRKGEYMHVLSSPRGGHYD